MLFPAKKVAVNAVLDLDTGGGRQFISREDYQRLEGSRDAQQYIIASLLSMIVRGTFGYCRIRFTRVLLHNIVPHPGPT
jgi:hypothetical protein